MSSLDDGHADGRTGGIAHARMSRDLAVMFYSHDTYGLGHLRRTLTLARFLHARSQLIVTGSPLAHRFPLPPHTDYIKLPSVVKLGRERYGPRYLQEPLASVRSLREDMLLSAARHYRPDLLIVDNVPRGLKGELLRTLRCLKEQSCRLVLGVRDVVDEAEWVQSTWAADGSYDVLDELYDLILVYGRQDVYDVAAEYGFSPSVSAKTRFVGYLSCAAPARSADEVRAELEMEADHLVLVMAGGGEDGYELLHAVADAIRLSGDRRRFECLLLGGPLMPPGDRRRVLALAEAEPSIRYVDFVDDVASYVAAADVVVSMGGYNSVCELLSARKAAIIVPRIAPRREQLIRAELLSLRGLVRMLHPEDLTPERMLEEIRHVLDGNGQIPPGVPAQRVARSGRGNRRALRRRPAVGLSADGVKWPHRPSPTCSRCTRASRRRSCSPSCSSSSGKASFCTSSR